MVVLSKCTSVEANRSSHYKNERMNWQENIITAREGIRDLLTATKTIAVLGIKTEAQANQPAFYVPSYLASAGFHIIPVPVYYPEVTQILGQKVYRKLVEIPAEVDLVNVFRRSQDVPGHLDDILAKRPGAVWMQSGISNAAVAEQLARAGIKVVQDRCLMVDHRILGK
jgi:predicted CoA-binding protein